MDNRNTLPNEDRAQPPDKRLPPTTTKADSASAPPLSLPIISLNNGHMPKNNGATSSSSVVAVSADNGGAGHGDAEASGPLLLLDEEGGMVGKSTMVVSFGPGGATRSTTLSANPFGRNLYDVPSSNGSGGLRRLIVLSCLFTVVGAFLAALIILTAGGYSTASCVNGKRNE